MRQFDSSVWSVIPGLLLLEVVQHVLRAIGRPNRKKVVISVLQGTATTHGNKPGISDLRENHLSLHLLTSCSQASILPHLHFLVLRLVSLNSFLLGFALA
jgi:hypothetical protein